MCLITLTQRRISLCSFSASKQLRTFFASTLSRNEPRNTAATTQEDIMSLISNWKSKVLDETTLSTDTITSTPLQLLSLTLNRTNIIDDTPATAISPVETALPPNYHLAYFPTRAYEKDLSPDGYLTTHSPPPPFLQRLWAGGELLFDNWNPLRVGQHVNMETKCRNVEVKRGAFGGENVFVWVDRDIGNKYGFSVRDTRCLVYMRRSVLKEKQRKIVKVNYRPDFEKTIHPTTILLFRYSAVTFNSHLIHYDHKYATEMEGHEGCLVHGPLTCTLLLDLLRDNIPEPSAQIKSFTYRTTSPLVVGKPFKISGKRNRNVVSSNSLKEGGSGVSYELWAENNEGCVAMKGTALIEFL
ncbi:2314_t:CDS:2 [Ambispora gerdemannii]|uniref:2314_t:CDS:1 n=1 Tax=Ambispora gerdemannii TaxID=144530 RepID=A0A9N9BW04_9GLOM|nr:2314_t:CDS:2 [Ambispora gerdemannii]